MKRLLTTAALTALLSTTAHAQDYGTLTPKYYGNDHGTLTNPYILTTPGGRTEEVKAKFNDRTPGDGRFEAGSPVNPFVTSDGQRLEVKPKYGVSNDAGSFANPYRLTAPIQGD